MSPTAASLRCGAGFPRWNGVICHRQRHSNRYGIFAVPRHRHAAVGSCTADFVGRYHHRAILCDRDHRTWLCLCPAAIALTGATKSIIGYATEFYYYSLLTVFSIMLIGVMMGLFQGAGKIMVIMKASLLGALVNIMLDQS